MRTVLPRVAIALMATFLVTPVPAHADPITSASCNPTTSVPLIEYQTIADSYPNGAIMDTQGNRKVICFKVAFFNIGSGAIVVDPVPGGTPPSADPGTDLDACTGGSVPISNSQLHIAVLVGTSSSSLCLRIGSVSKTITLAPGGGYTVPTFEVWRDGTWSEIDRDGCPVEYIEYSFGDGDDTCMTTPSRVFPPA